MKCSTSRRWSGCWKRTWLVAWGDGLMRWRGGWSPLLESRGSQLAFLAQKKDIAALAASISPLSQKPGFPGPVCACFASLGTAVTCRITGEIRWCALTVQQCVIAVVKIRASRETSPARYLFPFSIYASVRYLLGPLLANKRNFCFSLMQELWIFACFVIWETPVVVTLLISLPFGTLAGLVFLIMTLGI